MSELSRNAIRRICEADDKLKETFFLQVLEIKNFNTDPNQKSKIAAKFKLSDGVSVIHAMVLDQIQQKIRGIIPVKGVIEFTGYMKNKVNNKHLIIFQRPPKLIATPICVIGDPVEFEKREERGDFREEELCEKLNKMDISVPVKKPELQPMDNFDGVDMSTASSTNGLNQKLNQKDLSLMNSVNPEESEVNPFSVSKKALYGTQNGEHSEVASTIAGETTSQGKKSDDEVPPDYDDFTKYTPIAALTCNTNDWIIKARVTKKYERRTWSNARGKGYLMNVDLIDAFGSQIQATFFKEAVDKFDPIMKQNCVFTFSNGTVKLANSRFSSIKNDFSLVFDPYSTIVEQKDDDNIQSQAYNFMTIKQVMEIVGMRTVDFIGVVHSCGSVREKSLRNGMSKEQRFVQLADESGQCISVCIWGDFANKFDLGSDEHPVVAIKRATVSDYGGKSLNSNDDSQIVVNPAHRRTKQLQDWYKFLPDANTLGSVTQGRRENNNNEDSNIPGAHYRNKSMLAEILDQVNNHESDQSLEELKQNFFYVSGYVSFMKNDDKTFYLACPDEQCKKKVIEESVGWRCENCNKTYPNCVPTYMLLAKIADVSESQFVNFYRHEGTALMGLAAEKLKELKDQGDIQVINEAYADRLYRNFGFLLKLRVRPSYNDNSVNQYNYVCAKVLPHSYKVENNLLMDRLKAYKTKMGYVDQTPSYEAPKNRRQRTASEEARRKEEFESSDAQQRRIKIEKNQINQAQAQQPFV